MLKMLNLNCAPAVPRHTPRRTESRRPRSTPTHVSLAARATAARGWKQPKLPRVGERVVLNMRDSHSVTEQMWLLTLSTTRMNLRNTRSERGQTPEVTCRAIPFAQGMRGRGTRDGDDRARRQPALAHGARALWG